MTDRMLSAEKLSTLLRHLVSLGYYDSATIDRIEQDMCFGWLDADRPEGNTAAESVAQMVSQSAEMNGEDAFWRHMLRLPVAKFIGPMRNALRNYEAQSADRPECPKCGGSGTEEIKRQCGITEYWPCDCKASK